MLQELSRKRRGSVLVVSVAMLLSGTAVAAEMESTISHGGRLYDKWFTENKAPKPTSDHPVYPHKGGQYGKDTSWRCKECHGWDYKGKDGAYAKGGHATGIKGIFSAAGKDPKEIAALLRGPVHGYTEAQLSASDVDALALFVSKGQIDTAKYIDAATGKPKGDGAKGETYFNTICAGCHGLDGKKISTAPSLGSVAGNAYEMLHKVRNGQAGEAMPSLRALDPQISVDLVVHLQTLPK